MATPHTRGREELQPRATGGSGRGSSRTDTAVVVGEFRNEMVARVARYQFNKIGGACATIARKTP